MMARRTLGSGDNSPITKGIMKEKTWVRDLLVSSRGVPLTETKNLGSSFSMAIIDTHTIWNAMDRRPFIVLLAVVLPAVYGAFERLEFRIPVSRGAFAVVRQDAGCLFHPFREPSHFGSSAPCTTSGIQYMKPLTFVGQENHVRYHHRSHTGDVWYFVHPTSCVVLWDGRGLSP
jgi:hypothetical protein